jgi:hypothetical protein
MNLKHINITPPHTLNFEHMAIAHKVHFQDTENTFTTIWLIVLTVLVILLILKTFLPVGRADEFNPLAYLPMARGAAAFSTVNTISNV